MKKLFSFKNLRICICIISAILIVMFIHSSNKILALLGFISLGLMLFYDSFKKYKSTGKIPWLDILLDILCITP